MLDAAGIRPGVHQNLAYVLRDLSSHATMQQLMADFEACRDVSWPGVLETRDKKDDAVTDMN